MPRVYGLNIRTDFPFVTPLLPEVGPADLELACIAEPPEFARGELPPPVFTSPFRTPDDESVAVLHELEGCRLLRFTGAVDYFLWPDRILAHLRAPTQAPMLEIYLLGPVLSFVLEQRGVPALHASAVVSSGSAIAFLEASGGGKSSLAAALMQAGCGLLTDDILPVERQPDDFAGRAGFPQVRMWPAQAIHFLGTTKGLMRVHPEAEKLRVPVGPRSFGTFCASTKPLRAIYLPERRQTAEDQRIEITPLTRREALVEMVRHSFGPRIVEALGWQPRRMAFFSELLRRVPVRRLSYPNGWEQLPRVAEAVVADTHA